MSQCKFTAVGRHAVCQCLSRFYTVSLINNRTLVYAGALVGTHELNQIIIIIFAIIRFNGNCAPCNFSDHTGAFRKNADTRVLSCHPFHAGSYKRCFRTEKRNCLALHVCAHEGTVRIIVFQKRDKGCTDGNDLLRRYVHQIDFFRECFQYIRAMSARHITVYKFSVFCQHFTRLCYDFVFFHISRYILAFISNMMCLRINKTVRCFYKTVLVHNSVVGKRGNQTDIRTFRCFYRAHTTIVGIVYVTNLKSRTFSGETARSQCRKTAFMCQLCQRICLIHKLGKLGTSEEFLYSGNYGTDIDQCLGCHFILILGRHSFTDNTLHTG